MTIPDSVTSIGTYAFNGCNALDSVFYDTENPVTANANIFSDYTKPTLFVPALAIEKFQSTAPWSSFQKIAPIPGFLGLDEDSISIAIGDTATLTATTKRDVSELTWGSSNPAVATVDSLGNVTAVAGGETTITVSAIYLEDNSPLSAQCLVKVTTPYTLSYTLHDGNAWLTSMTTDESLVDVVIPAKVKLDDSDSLYDVTGIDGHAFYNNSSLRSVTIPGSVTTIGDSAFHACTNLTAIDIPNSVTVIGNSVFSECSGLTAISMPDSLTSIGDNEYQDCVSLTSIDIPNTVTSVGDYAFAGCTNLTSIVIPDSVTSIGDYAFAGSGLTALTIPASVTAIGLGIAEGCTDLAHYNVHSDNSVYSSIDGVLFDKDAFVLLHYPQGRPDHDYTIPGTVAAIGDKAFFETTSLDTITIPASVTTIGSSAFAGCTGLTSLTITEKVSSIGDDAFAGCTGLTAIYYDTESPVEASPTVFSDYDTPTLYVRDTAIDKIRSTEPWSLFRNVVMLYGVTGVAVTEADAGAQPVEVFNLHGIRIARSIEGLAPGIYIVRQGNTTRKVAIK